MSILDKLNNSGKLQNPVNESTKLLPISNKDVNLEERTKKWKLRKYMIILLLIIGSGVATYVHIHSLRFGWKQITKVATLIHSQSGKLKNHIQQKYENYDKM